MNELILIVDDEPDIARVLSYSLKQAGYRTLIAEDGSLALALALQERPDIILLDWMLPDLPGTEVCRQIRRQPQTANIPVIMVSARSEEIDRVVGFELGVDDYVTKPFSVRELSLRVEAILRHRREPSIPNPSFTIEAGTKRLQFGNSEVQLTELEVRIWNTLGARPHQVVTKDELLRSVWGPSTHITTAAVDSHVKRIRAKLGPNAEHLQTMRGVGYMLTTPTL